MAAAHPLAARRAGLAQLRNHGMPGAVRPKPFHPADVRLGHRMPDGVHGPQKPVGFGAQQQAGGIPVQPVHGDGAGLPGIQPAVHGVRPARSGMHGKPQEEPIYQAEIIKDFC